MNTLVYFALVGIATAPLSLLAGVFAGAWIVYRTQRHLPPAPAPKDILRAFIPASWRKTRTKQQHHQRPIAHSRRA